MGQNRVQSYGHTNLLKFCQLSAVLLYSVMAVSFIFSAYYVLNHSSAKMSCDVRTQRGARQAAVIDNHRREDICVYDRQQHALADGEGREGGGLTHAPAL